MGNSFTRLKTSRMFSPSPHALFWELSTWSRQHRCTCWNGCFGGQLSKCRMRSWRTCDWVFRVGVLWVGKQFRDRCGFNHHALLHDDDSVAVRCGHPKIMGDQYDGHITFLGKVTDEDPWSPSSQTSRPVVGSSAINKRGSQASAMAIMTRWHMPPDSSNG